MADQARICQSTRLPVNALAAGPYTKISRTEFAAAGVARISLGSALARSTQRLIHDAATSPCSETAISPRCPTASLVQK